MEILQQKMVLSVQKSTERAIYQHEIYTYILQAKSFICEFQKRIN
jgi:hypothetical protein